MRTCKLYVRHLPLSCSPARLGCGRLTSPATHHKHPLSGTWALEDASLYERGEVGKRRQRSTVIVQRSERTNRLSQNKDTKKNKQKTEQIFSLTVGGSLSYEYMRVLDYFGHARTLQKNRQLFFS